MAPKIKDQALLDIMSDLNKDSKVGPVQFLKDGDTTIKLLMPAGRTDIRLFYQRFMTQWKTGPQPYFLVAGIITEADEDGVADPTRVRYIKLTKTIVLELVNLISKKWKLFADEGPLVVVTKGKGKNGKVEYKTIAVPETYALIGDEIWPDISIEDAALQQEAAAAELFSKSDEPEPAEKL